MNNDLLTLLSLAGVNQVPDSNSIYKEIELKQQEIDNDVEDLNDLLRMAGQETDDSEVCDTCGQEICQCPDEIELEVDEAQAAYDYGKNPTQKNGEEYDIDAYKFLGKDDLPVRYTPARSGDNPLTGKRGISSVSENRFANYLKKVEESK